MMTYYADRTATPPITPPPGQAGGSEVIAFITYR